MDITIQVLLILHVIGAALVFGMWAGNFKKGIVLPGQFHASLLQLITGFALYFIQMTQMTQMGENSPTFFHMFAGIKILLAIIISVAAFFGQKKYKAGRATGSIEAGKSILLAHTVGGFALINIILGVLLHG